MPSKPAITNRIKYKFWLPADADTGVAFLEGNQRPVDALEMIFIALPLKDQTRAFNAIEAAYLKAKARESGK